MKQIFSLLLLTSFAFQTTHTMEEDETTKKTSKASQRVAIDLIWAARRKGDLKHLEVFTEFTNANKSERYNEEMIGRVQQYTQTHLKDKIWHTARLYGCKKEKRYSTTEYQSNLYVSEDGYLIVFIPPINNKDEKHKLIMNYYNYNKEPLIKELDTKAITNVFISTPKKNRNSSLFSACYRLHYTDSDNKKQVIEINSNNRLQITASNNLSTGTFLKEETKQYSVTLSPWGYQSKRSRIIDKTNLEILPTKYDCRYGIIYDEISNIVKLYKIEMLPKLAGVASALIQLYTEQNNMQGMSRTLEDLFDIKERNMNLVITELISRKVLKILGTEKNLYQPFSITKQTVNKALEKAGKSVKRAIRNELFEI